MNKIIAAIVGETPQTTPDRLLAVRKELGFSQAELGRLVGMSRFTISKMERGIYPISRTLDLSLAFILRTREFVFNPSFDSPKSSKPVPIPQDMDVRKPASFFSSSNSDSNQQPRPKNNKKKKKKR